MAIELKERPIFIIGAERSGTTLVMAILGCHPRIAFPEVAWYYPRFRPYLHTYGDLGVDENFRTLASEMIHGLKTPYFGVETNPLTIVDEVIDSLREKSFAGIYCAMLDRYARSVDKPRWGEKTPYNMFFVKEIIEDFPNAQFIFITRDGRDSIAEYMQSAFGSTNAFCGAELWLLGQNAVKPWRERLDSTKWLDVQYETLVRNPEAVLKEICSFLDEKYHPEMLNFHQSKIAQERSKSRDHAPLGHPISDKFVGVYKEFFSLRDQKLFAAVAGDELRASGYEVDAEPIEISNQDAAVLRELDGRHRAALLDGPEGHIIYESYNDWLIDQQEERKEKGLWNGSHAPGSFPIGHPEEEIIMGQCSYRKWKDHFSIKRSYTGKMKF